MSCNESIDENTTIFRNTILLDAERGIFCLQRRRRFITLGISANRAPFPLFRGFKSRQINGGSFWREAAITSSLSSRPDIAHLIRAFPMSRLHVSSLKQQHPFLFPFWNIWNIILFHCGARNPLFFLSSLALAVTVPSSYLIHLRFRKRSTSEIAARRKEYFQATRGARHHLQTSQL